MTERIFQGESSARLVCNDPSDQDISIVQSQIDLLGKKIEKLAREIGREERALDFYILAPAEEKIFTAWDPWADNRRSLLTEKYRQRQGLQDEKLELEENRKAAAYHLKEEIEATREELPGFVADGRIGSVLAGLQQFDDAAAHFEAAARDAAARDLELEAADFRLQNLLAGAQRQENWEEAAQKLEEFFQESSREVALRTDGPEDFVRWLEDQGDTGSWRILRAEALGAFIEQHCRHQRNFAGSPLEPASQTLTQYLKEAAHKKVSQEELLALLDGLKLIQDARVTQGYELGADAKLNDLEKISREMAQTLQFAVQAAVHHPNNREMQEMLGELRGLTHFHFWQQAGLPTRAVYNFWEHRDEKNDEKLSALIREKAPHFFDADGKLLPQEKIAPPADGEESADAENSLHRDDAPFAESTAISVGTTMAGAGVGSAAGAKAGAAVGIACGPWCAAAGAIAGFFGGEKIVSALHAKEREPFLDDIRLAGFPLGRVTAFEGSVNDSLHDVMSLGAVAMIGAGAPAMARGSNKIARALQWTARPETWKYFGRQAALESRYTLRWMEALGAGVRGIFSKTPATPVIHDAALSFEKVWERLAPWHQSRGRSYWADLWRQMEEPPPPPASAQALIDRVLAPVNLVWDKTFGRATQFGSNRLKTIRASVFANHPEFSYSVNPLIGRKELLRASVLADAGLPVNGNGNGASRWPAFERFAKWMKQNVGTPEFERLHRWGFPFAAAGLFHDADNDAGGGWGWDGEWDSPLEFIPFFLWTNAASKPLFDNSVLGADIAGAINLFTIDQMLALSDREGAPDFDRYRGAHYHYITATVANSIFLSGLHYVRRIPLGQLAGSVPFARTLPSMTSFPAAFSPKSSFEKPNFATASGLLLTLGYQSYLTGYQVSDIFSHRKLVNTDPYYTWQRGTKYATVVPAVNALQAALGYRSALGQTAGRVLGLPFDIGLAKVDPPFLNKGNWGTKERRLLDEGDEAALKEAWDVFVNANTSLDLGGVLGRVWDENGGGYLGWKPLRVGHWRWERRGIETWTSPNELPSLDKRKGLIEELAAAGDEKKLSALTQMYYDQFADPQAPWHKSPNEQRGMMIFAFMTKYFAAKALQGEQNLRPFIALEQRRELVNFFQGIPTPKDHAELLDYVRQVDEGEFVWVMQKTPQEAPPGVEVIPSVSVLRQPANHDRQKTN